MSKEDRQADTGAVRLPGEPVDWLTRPFAQFLDIKAAAGAVLLLLALAALLLSQSSWADPFLSVRERSVGLHIGLLDCARSLC
jgi:NhaA family Na+:H+ antiporter